MADIGGSGGVVLHYDGTGWAEMDSGVTVDLGGVWHSPQDKVFAVGDDGMILSYPESEEAETFPLWAWLIIGVTAPFVIYALGPVIAPVFRRLIRLRG